MKHPLLAPALLLLLASSLAARPKHAAPPPNLPPAAPVAEAPKAQTTGTFRDAAGHAHAWTISQAHTLDWEGTPYLPVGGMWTPQSWQANAPASAQAADQQFLETLKSHGVYDVCLTAGARGLTHVPPPVVQKTLDALEAGGFHYGLEIADFPHDALVGYVVKPGAYRNPAPPTVGPARFSHIPGLADAVYMLVSTHDGEVDDAGDAQIENEDTALVTLKNAGPDDVLLLYPQRVYAPGTPESRLPDLWQGYDEYRDRLLTWFRSVRLGPGFRYFLDPLTDKLALSGEVENLVPTTDGYRQDFGAWLDKRYAHNIDDLNKGWGVANRDLPDFTAAARSLPLWYGARGVPAIYDPVTHNRYEVSNKPRIGGHVWQDIADFRVQSVRGYMNAISDVLKKGVADVPVVYQWTGHTALFSNDRTLGGYDGLCMTEGDDSPLERGAYAYGQAEEAAKTSWLLASTSLPRVRGALLDTWDTLQGIGARGFLATRLPAAPADPLDWLNSYSASLQLGASALSAVKPRVLWYPASAGLDIGVRQLPGGVWWLPGYLPGQRVTLGSELSGYVLPNPDGRLPTYVVWSPQAALAQANFDLGKTARPLVTDAAGALVKFAKKGDVFSVPVGPDPVLISRVNSLPLPTDAADAAQREAKRLLDMADAQKINTQSIKDQYFYATNSIPDIASNADIRYSLLQRVLANLTEALRPYTWVEAESASQYTFDSLTPDPRASGGAYLSLDTTLDPPSGPSPSATSRYQAHYRFSVNAPGRYAIWAATSPLGAQTSSPFTWKIDDALPNDTEAAQIAGGVYAGRFQWANLGAATLVRGVHTLTLTVVGRASDGRYALALDALCVTRAAFAPDGPRQPPIDLPPPAPDAKPKKK